MNTLEREQKGRALLGRRKRSYKMTLGAPAGDAALRDLAKFCRAHGTTFHPDQPTSDKLQGRREVWLRIQSFLNLTDEELWNLYGGN
jgi:hypothetical protein